MVEAPPPGGGTTTGGRISSPIGNQGYPDDTNRIPPGAGGGPPPKPNLNVSNFQIPQIKKPTWYHGIHPPSALASTVRDAWFAFLGDLSGYPYSSGLISINVTISCTVTDLSGDPLAGATVIVSVLDSNTNELLGQETGMTDGSGKLPLDLGSITDAASAQVFVIWEATWNGHSAVGRLNDQTLGSIETLGIPMQIYTGTGTGTVTKTSFILQGSVFPDGVHPAANAAVTVAMCGTSATAETNAGGVYSATLGSFQFDPAQTYTVTIEISGVIYSAQLAGTQIQNADGRTLNVSDGKAYIS